MREKERKKAERDRMKNGPEDEKKSLSSSDFISGIIGEGEDEDFFEDILHGSDNDWYGMSLPTKSPTSTTDSPTVIPTPSPT